MLTSQDIEEMKVLHKEWFPINYPQKFFDKIVKTNVIAIGCFYQVPLEKPQLNNMIIEEESKTDDQSEPEDAVARPSLAKSFPFDG